MAVTQITDPKVTVRNLVKNNWNAANTQSVTPTFSTGWYDKKKKLPILTVTTPRQFVRHRGTDGSGNGVVQIRSGSVLADAWVDRGVVAGGSAVGTAGAKNLAYQMFQEVDRIVTANQNSVSDFLHIEVGTSTELVETEESPAVYRRQAQIRYWWIKQPV